MLVKDIRNYEYKYYGCHNDMVVPELLCYYFEEGLYELVHYLAEAHQIEFAECRFYLMMSKMMLNYEYDAEVLYRKNIGEWYNICKQFGIYWKHVALYGLLFQDYSVSNHFQEIFDEHYDNACVELLMLCMENPNFDITRLEAYQNVLKKYPMFSHLRNEKKEQKKELVTFESMQWKIWSRYNEKIGNGAEYGIEKVYAKNDIAIYSYKPKEVAASMHIIVENGCAMILDCGCELNDMEAIRIPAKKILSFLGIEKVAGVLISHAHMDHYGSMNELKEFDSYMTQETKQLIKCVSPEIYLGNVKQVEPRENFYIEDIEVKYIPNGHIRGSAMIDINWRNQLRILYTGDYSCEDQETVEGFCVDEILRNPKRVDVLLTETTYGNRIDMLTLEQYETVFKILCEKYSHNGNKIIIPSFAVGRCQEVALLLSDMVKENGRKVLIDGMAATITGYYQMSLGKNILNKNISVCNNDLEYEEKISNNDIILASSGMIREGSTSAKYIEKMIDETNTCVIKVGFISAEEHMLRSIKNRRNMNLRFVDIPLSAHAGYKSLVEITEKISPDCAVYVHGQGIFK